MCERGNAKSKGHSPALNEEDHCLKARTTRKIDLAKPQQADCHLFGARVNNLPRWYAAQPPLYDIEKTYLENALHGPFFNAQIPKRTLPPQEKWINFLGHKVASPLGVPAGPLLTANWIKLAAELGFDIVTYKTIRSTQHPAHPLPNMIYVNASGSRAEARADPPEKIEHLAVTNSFGMPSMTPEFLLEDIERANRSLGPGQVMIVSVVGTPRTDLSFQEDFVRAASLAKDAGAKLIEANFSCPNVDKKEGILYMSPESIEEIGRALVRAIHPLPLILKMGVFASKEEIRKSFLAAAKAGVHAICGINSVSMHVTNRDAEPALGKSRPTSGVCGGPIYQAALSFLHTANATIHEEKLDLILLGCGGITAPEQFDPFLEAGALSAMTATGMLWDPFLALRYHEKKQNG